MTEYAPYPKFTIPIPPELEGRIFESSQRDRELALRFYDQELWVAEGFDLQTEMYQLDGPTVEIAGPTREGYWPLDDIDIPNPTLVSNISLNNRPITFPGEVDFLADGTNMPLADNSVSVVLVSGFPMISDDLLRQDQSVWRPIERKAQQEYIDLLCDDLEPTNNLRLVVIKEAYRLLESGGILVAHLTPKDIDSAVHYGFNLMLAHSIYREDGQVKPVPTCILKKI